MTTEAELASDTAKRAFRRFNRYTQNNCILMCLNDTISLNCSVDLPEVKITYTKINVTDQICIDKQVRDLYMNASFIYGCMAKCPIECNTVDYKVSSSSAAYPSEAYKRLIDIYFNTAVNLNPEYSRFINMTEHEEKLLTVNVFFKV